MLTVCEGMRWLAGKRWCPVTKRRVGGVLDVLRTEYGGLELRMVQASGE